MAVTRKFSDKRLLTTLGVIVLLAAGSITLFFALSMTDSPPSTSQSARIGGAYGNLTDAQKLANLTNPNKESKNPLAKGEEHKIPSSSKTSELIHVRIVNSLTGRFLKGVPVYATPLPAYLDRCCEFRGPDGRPITPKPLFCAFDISGGAFPKPDRSVGFDGAMFNPPCFTKMFVTNSTGWATISGLPANFAINDRGVPTNVMYYLLTLRAPGLLVPPWDSVPISNVSWAIMPLQLNQTSNLTLSIPSTLEVREFTMTISREGDQIKWAPPNITVGLGDIVKLHVVNEDREDSEKPVMHGFALNGTFWCCGDGRWWQGGLVVKDIPVGNDGKIWEFNFDPFIANKEGTFAFWDPATAELVNGKIVKNANVDIGQLNVIKDWTETQYYNRDLEQVILRNDPSGSRLDFTIINRERKDLTVANLTLSDYASLSAPTLGKIVRIPASMRIPWRNEGNNTNSFSVNFEARVTAGSIYIFEISYADGRSFRYYILAQ